MTERCIAVIGYDGAELLDLACITSALSGANRIAGQRLYRTEILTRRGRAVACESGLVLNASGSLKRATGPYDTLIVSGGHGHEAAAADPVLIGHVRRLTRVSRRVASVCTGSTILAACGLLDGKRAATHWQYAGKLARDYPRVIVDPRPIYIHEDDGISTAAGVTSALDLTLAFITEDHGENLSRQVARALVTYLQRPGNQAQISMFVANDPPDHRLVRSAVEFVQSHVAGDLDTASLARRFGLSERHLNRLFLEHVGETPGRFVRRARTETAASLLASTSLPVGVIAARCGFGTPEGLRQAFVRQYGLAPSRFRSAQTVQQPG